MGNLKIIVSVFIFFIILQSCYVSKSIERDVKVSLDENFTVKITNTGKSNFIKNYSEQEYKKAFIEGMKAEFVGSHIIIDNNNPEFNISIKELTITESTISETITDINSPDNEKIFELTSLKLSSNGSTVKANGEKKQTWWADKSKDEKVTNSRLAGEIVTGDNKDKKNYRKKEFDKDIVHDLTLKCGRRSSVRIIKNITQMIK